MILDERTEFCDAASAILAVGNALIGDVIDLNPTSIAPNTVTDLSGSDLWLVIQVDTAFVGATSTTKFELASDSTADLATSKTVHYATPAIPVATLVAGYIVACVKLPYGAYERYLGIWETVATANVTAGKINAFLTADPALWKAYADAAN